MQLQPRMYRRAFDKLSNAAAILVNELPIRKRIALAFFCHLHQAVDEPGLIPSGALRERVITLWKRAALKPFDDADLATAHLSDHDLKTIAQEVLALAFQVQKLYCGCETENARNLETS